MTAAPAVRYAFETMPDFRVRVTGGAAAYLIDARPRGWTCTCPAFGFAPSIAKTCKHLVAFRAHLSAVATEPLASTIAAEIAQRLDAYEPTLAQLEARAASDPIRRAWQRAAEAERKRGPVTVRTTPGALAQWRRELAAGTRTPTTFDQLWRAACDEANQTERGR